MLLCFPLLQKGGRGRAGKEGKNIKPQTRIGHDIGY